MSSIISTDPDYARRLDREDELASFRDEFVMDDPGLIYLDGNSLGRLPRRSRTRLDAVIAQEWGGRLIRGWGESWFSAPARVGGKIARLLGAAPDQVVVSDSTSVNLFKLAVAALQYQAEASPGRTRVVTDDLNFPSDLYVLQGALRLFGPEHELVVVPSCDGLTPPEAELSAALDDRTALLSLTHTAFKSGATYDMAALTAQAHAAGALVLWDLSHSAGAVPLALDRHGVDLAVGCTYKYLNGGPGAPAFLYVRHDFHDRLRSPVWGWFSRKDQFDFRLEYEPAPGILRFLAGTPSMLSLAAVEPAVDLLLEAGIERLRAKSMRQTAYLVALWEAWLEPLGVRLNSPRDPARRGSHISLGHPDGLRIDRALIEEMDVIPDFRYPDNIRLGVAPLYTSFSDIYEGMRRLRTVLVERRYEKYPAERPEVT